MKENIKPYYILLFALALFVNFIGIDVRFFSDDPGLYASISKDLLYRKGFFELFTYGRDWLDKPHFPFWIVLLSFKLFGIKVWAYRLPALIFFLIGLRYTYLFSRKYYGQEIAWIAILIVATSQHLIMSNTDVRAEPYLMALVIGSIYHISHLEERFSLFDLALAAFLTACALMTKGLFVIVPIYGAWFGQLIFQKKYDQLFRLKWLVLILLTIIFTLPELYALYIQFDLHPEKTVFNRHHVSGIRWFLWDSQFGRFANNGPITRKSGDLFFYVHTLLWAFAPWCPIFYYAVYKNIKEIWYKRVLTEYYTISGGLLLLLLFSLSRFQLPFYTNTIFPLFAIITAPFCHKQLSGIGTSYRKYSLWLYTIAFTLVILVINYFLRPAHILFFIVDVIVFGSVAFLVITKIEKSNIKVFLLTCTAVLFANFYMNTIVYNEMAGYNGEIKAASYINQHQFDKYYIYSFTYENNIFQFYSKKPVGLMPLDSFKNLSPQSNIAVYAGRKLTGQLKQNHIGFKVIQAFENYPQEAILPAFINKTTRYKVLDSVYLITK